MKRKLRILLLAAAILMPIPLVTTLIVSAGCTTTQQRATYNSLYSLEKTTSTIVDGYFAMVINGSVPTNGVPQVSTLFNKFQASFLLALDAAQYNTNAMAPAALQVESQDLINLITILRKK